MILGPTGRLSFVMHPLRTWNTDIDSGRVPHKVKKIRSIQNVNT
jgi:hypothetical protein